MKKQKDFKLFYSGFKWDMLFLFVSGILSIAESVFFETSLFTTYPFVFIYGTYSIGRFIHIVLEKKQKDKKKEIKWDIFFIFSLAIALILLNETNYIHIIIDHESTFLMTGYWLGRFVGYITNKELK